MLADPVAVLVADGKNGSSQAVVLVTRRVEPTSIAVSAVPPAAVSVAVSTVGPPTAVRVVRMVRPPFWNAVVTRLPSGSRTSTARPAPSARIRVARPRSSVTVTVRATSS